MAQTEFDALTRTDPETLLDPLTLELVFDPPLDQAEVVKRVATALRDAGAAVSAAFDSQDDRFFFVDFADIDPKGQEAEVFAFARAMGVAAQAQEVNPVLTDSLYGAAATGAAVDTESFLSLCETPRNSTLAFGWHHPRIDTPSAWAHTRGQGSVVAVIDTGYSSHFELRDVIQQQGQRNFVEGGTDAQDRFSGGMMTHPGHGTLVMSVIASRGTAAQTGETGTPGAVTGTAPAAKVLPIRAIRSVIDFTQRRVGSAIMHAVDQNADVISMALGGPSRVAATEQALRNAVANGTVIVCAAGNCWPWVVFPAAYAEFGLCTAIAALQPDLRPWDKSGQGPAVSFSVFGEHVWGAAKNAATDPDAGIRASQGTTLATSMTAGVAALWVAHHGGRTALLAHAQDIGTTVQAMWVHCATSGMTRPAEWGGSTKLGAGVLNAARTLATPLPQGDEALQTPTETVETTGNILLTHMANNHPEAVDDVTEDMIEFAPELLWLSYRAGAKQRALSTGTETRITPDQPSADLSAAIVGKPALRALFGAM